MRAGITGWASRRWALLLLSVVALSRGVVYLVAAAGGSPLPAGMAVMLAAVPQRTGLLIGIAWALVGAFAGLAALRDHRGDTALLWMSGLWTGGAVAYTGAALFLGAPGDWALAVVCAVFAALAQLLRRETSVPVTPDYVALRLRINADGQVEYLQGGCWVALQVEHLE
jgi:hypothetical protein